MHASKRLIWNVKYCHSSLLMTSGNGHEFLLFGDLWPVASIRFFNHHTTVITNMLSCQLVVVPVPLLSWKNKNDPIGVYRCKRVFTAGSKEGSQHSTWIPNTVQQMGCHCSTSSRRDPRAHYLYATRDAEASSTILWTHKCTICSPHVLPLLWFAYGFWSKLLWTGASERFSWWHPLEMREFHHPLTFLVTSCLPKWASNCTGLPAGCANWWLGAVPTSGRKE